MLAFTKGPSLGGGGSPKKYPIFSRWLLPCILMVFFMSVTSVAVALDAHFVTEVEVGTEERSLTEFHLNSTSGEVTIDDDQPLIEQGGANPEPEHEEEASHTEGDQPLNFDEIGQGGANPEPEHESEGGEHTTDSHSSENNDHPVDFDEIGHEGESHEEHESEPGHAVLFPSFAMTVGLAVFYLLTRYYAALPFTAVMFLIGTLMGIGVELLPDSEDHVSITTRMWANIDSEVLLLVFLPGLIFKDSFSLNVHLFRNAFVQCLIFAFPLVLLGTFLTACVGKYMFPYNWSWNLALTFGSILSATDPVAVAALLEEVGAPPRLKVHIGGEALLNDGAAIVFFTIFAERYFFELGKEGFGEEVMWGRGFELFFRMSLGGMCIGLAFGGAMLGVLNLLDRRFSREENIVEVTATCAIAYLNYYVAEVVCHTSGVIATVACGVTVKFFGRAMINDARLLEDFWILLEHMLNTVLFTLGGAVWGAAIASGEKDGSFEAQDWGYLILLYVMLTLIRLLLFFGAYPITCRIGLKTNVKETVFQIYGGLRGAVGIALAIALDSAVKSNAEAGSEYLEQTNKVFGLIGGVAFCTLCINGTTAGPFLVWLGLADATSTREKIVEAYRVGYRLHVHCEFVKLLSQDRFRHVNFGLVKAHVPALQGLTKVQLLEAIERHKDTTATDEYAPPHLEGVLPYLTEEPDSQRDVKYDRNAKSTEQILQDFQDEAEKVARAKRAQNRQKRRRRKSNIHYLMSGEPLSAVEMRMLFISLLKAAYERQIDEGELADAEFLAIALQQSLEFAADKVSNGGVLQDWEYVHLFDGPASGIFNKIKHNHHVIKFIETFFGRGARANVKYTIKRLKIERSMCFMAAHRSAQKYVQHQFENAESELSEATRVVLNESQEQRVLAEKVLLSYKPEDVANVTSHKFCSILLNSGQHYITKLVKRGLLKDDEAEHWVKEIEEDLEHVVACTLEDHPGEIKIGLPLVPERINENVYGELHSQPLSEIPEEAQKELARLASKLSSSGGGISVNSIDDASVNSIDDLLNDFVDLAAKPSEQEDDAGKGK